MVGDTWLSPGLEDDVVARIAHVFEQTDHPNSSGEPRMNQRSGDSHVQVAGTDIPLDEAVGSVLDYCGRVSERTWTAPRNGVGDPVNQLPLGAFAYRTYDCIPTGASSGIEPIDVFVADGLNAQMRAADIGGALLVTDLLAREIEAVDRDHICFWELARNEIDEPPSAPSSRAWPLWRAWTILMGVPGIDVARAHKILHHKRPHAFPLIDNQTLPLLASGHAWASIYDDLIATAPGWAELERRVGPQLTSNGGVTLTRLRLHDILLWRRATQQAWSPTA